MIISTSLKFVFAAIPKTGTHSVRRALRAHMAPEDLEQVGLFVQRSLPIPELARIGHGHITLAQLRPHMPPEDFAAFFKFAFVRNPFDRFVSYSSFITREVGHFDRDPRKVMRYFLANPPWDHILFRPQHEFVTDRDGALLTDYIGRTEQMQQCYDEICVRIGIPSATLEQVNSSRRGSYRDYYDQQLTDGVARLYARDLELFGYQF
ncbi:MAG TPA: sulfotransferase family 2 domain-containing protein [Sphingomicrobium sp.]